MFSKNKLTESLLLPVFQVVLGAPDLRNVNQEFQNFPYIDLADDRSRIAIQVTTERGTGKVTETLTGFIAQGYQRRYDRLVFFILTASGLRYARNVKQKWQTLCEGELDFDPDRDIITTLDLFPLIQGLPNPDVYALHDIISRSVVGETYVDVGAFLTRLSSRQLENEKKSGKYIPDIFVETRETKNLARSFSHPALFFHRTLDSLSRLNISGWNAFLAKAGLPPLVFPDLQSYGSAQNLAQVAAAAAELSDRLMGLTRVLSTYKKVSWEGPPPFPVKADRKYYYDESIFSLQSGLGLGLSYELEGLVSELNAACARIFILTGRAGQGKTNLVCDFVENFLLKHKIPCAYLTGRLLRSIPSPDLGDSIQRLLFEGATSSFAEAAQLLSGYACRMNKPFVFIIDGLNEHHRISEFSEQLQHFIKLAIEYPHLKLFLTCRSEFFQQRFGALTAGALKPHTFVLEGNERRLDEESYQELLAGYFKFFKVRPEMVSDQAEQSLRQDRLLLRFFCEAYGAKDKPEGYVQPFVASIYREEIFNTYLTHKLGMAEGFFRRLTGQETPRRRADDLIRVLEKCLEHMLEKWQFSNVPVSAIPSELDKGLYALLDEELILRRDAPPGASVFAPSEEAINFTFDDFRDFLLAQYLIDRVYQADRGRFGAYIARSDPKDSQIIEGLKKFLFYASRNRGNEEFWSFYRSQPWYADVYDDEIFNIDAKLLRAEDRNLTVPALRAGGDRARAFSRHLARCWHPRAYPVLNLDLLLSVVTQSGDTQFDDLIAAPFESYPSNRLSASAFCIFITECILPKFKPGPDVPENGLFRFLILLLPVDSGPDLNSESYEVFRRVLDLHPDYGIGLLKESLQYGPTRHRPHVWRLLTLVSTHLSPSDPLLAEADMERARSGTDNPVLHREVTRFLDRCRSSVAQPRT